MKLAVVEDGKHDCYIVSNGSSADKTTLPSLGSFSSTDTAVHSQVTHGAGETTLGVMHADEER
jgi:hypothetical protein